MSLFGDLFDFVVDTVVDVVETTGTIVVDTVEFAGSVAADVIDVALEVAEGTVSLAGDVIDGLGVIGNDGLDLTTELIAGFIGVILSSNSSDEEREAAEYRHQRQMFQLREQSDQKVKQYQQKQQEAYQSHVNYAVNKQKQALRHEAFKQLHHERDTVRLYLSELKPRKDALKIELDACADLQQQQRLKAEIKALNRLLTPLYEQLKHIKLQLEQLHQNH